LALHDHPYSFKHHFHAFLLDDSHSNGPSLSIEIVSCIVVSHSISIESFTFGAPNTHVEASFRQIVGDSMDSGCRYGPLLSNG